MDKEKEVTNGEKRVSFNEDVSVFIFDDSRITWRIQERKMQESSNSALKKPYMVVRYQELERNLAEIIALQNEFSSDEDDSNVHENINTNETTDVKNNAMNERYYISNLIQSVLLNIL